MGQATFMLLAVVPTHSLLLSLTTSVQTQHRVCSPTPSAVTARASTLTERLTSFYLPNGCSTLSLPISTASGAWALMRFGLSANPQQDRSSLLRSILPVLHTAMCLQTMPAQWDDSPTPSGRWPFVQLHTVCPPSPPRVG